MPATPPPWVDTRTPDAVEFDTDWVCQPRSPTMAAALAVVARVAHRHELVALGSGIAHVLLTGPAGSGKTTLAAAIATRVVRELAGQDVAVYTVPATTSGARWAELGAHLAERGRDPRSFTLVLVDEIDAVGSARVGAVSQASGPAAESLPLLLAAIDGLQSGPPAVAAGTLWIGMSASRRINPMLSRPGRLGVDIELGLADQAQRLALLEHTLRLVQVEPDARAALARTCRRTGDCTAAEVVELGREAIARAYSRAGAGAAVSEADLRGALAHAFHVTDRPVTADMARVAIHEAGHWLVAEAVTGRAPTIAMVSDDDGSGRTDLATSATTAAEAVGLMAVAVAGAEAERLVLGDVALAASHDLRVAAGIIGTLSRVGELPGARVAPLFHDDHPGWPVQPDVQSALIAGARARAHDILAAAGEDAIRALAARIEAGEVTAEDVGGEMAPRRRPVRPGRGAAA